MLTIKNYITYFKFFAIAKNSKFIHVLNNSILYLLNP